MEHQLKPWARSQEEEEEFLRDEQTGRLRAVLLKLRQGQRRTVLDTASRRDLPQVRYEAGVYEGLRKAIELITEDGDGEE